MALNYNGLLVSVPDAPTGYTPAPVTTFNDWEYKNGRTILIATVGAHDPDPVVTMTNIAAACDSAVQSKLTDFDAVANTVDVYANLRNIEVSSGEKYTDDPENYVCAVDVLVKVS